MNLPRLPNVPANLWPTPLTLPTMYDLPSEDPEEPGLADMFHGLQPQLLDETLSLPQYPEDRTFRAFDLNLYYDSENTGWYKRPDWFLAVGAPRLYKGLVTRSSYVMWEEKIAPTIVIEFLSPGTEAEDLGPFFGKPRSAKIGKPPGKFVVYEEILKVPNYIVFDHRTSQLRFFRLVNERYQEQQILPDNPKIWIPEINLGLGLRTETFRGIIYPWLRWCDRSGNFFPTPAEAADARTVLFQAKTEAAIEKAALATAQVEQFQLQQTQSILKLLSMGLAPEQITEVVGVTIAEIESARVQASP